VRHYVEYKRRLGALCAAGEGSFANSELLELDERQGFGFAVKAALPLVRTPLVLVIQARRGDQRARWACSRAG